MATNRRTTKTTKSDEAEEVEEIPQAYEAPKGEGDPPFTPDRPDLGPEPQQ